MLPLVTHPSYSFPFPAKHRFPMEKFQLLHQFLQEKGIATAANTFRPGTSKLDILELSHCPEYLQRLKNNLLNDKEQRRLGLPWSEAFIKRTFIAPSGTLLAAHYALEHGIACHLAGGTHHAHYDFGSGFCALNDLVIAAKALIAHKVVKRILIFDCDVHQGDGTASMLENQDDIFTCSIHCGKNFPARKAKSNLDVELAKGTADQEYLDTVERTLEQAIALAQPEFIFYDAGVDIYSGDPLGLLNVSLQGLQDREHLVLAACLKKNIPVATVIGGGYDDNRLALTQRHAFAVEAAQQLLR